MGKTVQVTCDGCGRDITTRSNMVDYRLVLAAEDKPGYGNGAYTAMHISPPIDCAHYFCGLGCLDHWRAREHHLAASWKAWSDEWRMRNGTQMAPGVWSYSAAPDEERAVKKVEFEGAALAAFPMKYANT